MGLSWQQGPLAPGATGRFLVPDPLPERMLFAEPLRRRTESALPTAGSQVKAGIRAEPNRGLHHVG